jgi:bifunctional DNase/RNase
MRKIRVEIAGLSSAPSMGGAYGLLLKESYGSRRLLIIIGVFEAHAINIALEGIEPPRPMTHDLLKNVIRDLGATVQEVFIDEVIESTYYAKLILNVSDLTVEVDARPSDAIALAVRTGAPIYVNELVLDEHGILPTSDTVISNTADELERESMPEETDENETFETRMANLERQLKEAIDNEDYERAAKLRDKIRELRGGEN